MPTIRIADFRGLLPKADRRSIATGFAQTAANVKFDAGGLSPIRAGVNGDATGTDDTGTLYFHFNEREHPTSTQFYAWGDNFQVTVARSPVPNDQHNRLYWCVFDPNNEQDPSNNLRAVVNPLTNPAPAMSPTGSGASYRPGNGYRVGIPAPQSPPLFSDATQTAAIGSVANLSADSPIKVTSPGHSFANGDRVRITINSSLPKGDSDVTDGVPPEPGAPPSNVGRLWALDGKEGVVIDSTSNEFRILGVGGISSIAAEALSNDEKNAVTIEQFFGSGDLEARAYVFTYVSVYGEEGPPSPPSEVKDVYASGTVQVDVGDIAHSYLNQGGDRANVNRVRIYRSAAGQSAAFFKVGEIGLSGNINQSWSESFTDNVPSVSLGEVLPSEKWFPPPIGLRGIKMLPNGFMVGWKGNMLYFTEPNLPHAWNPDYARSIDADIINVESFGNTLVIGTRGRPYLASGSDPASMSIRKADVFAPLVNNRAMVDAGAGVLFPSSSGLYLVSPAGSRNLTEQHFDQRTWEQIVGDLQRGVFHDNRIIFFAKDKQPLVIDMNGDRIDISTLTGVNVSAATIADKDLVLVVKEGAGWSRMRRFKSDSEVFLSGTWKSGLITMPKACNMAVAQVFASDYPVTVDLYFAQLNASGQARLDDDGPDAMQSFSVTASGPEPIRLPSGYLSREYVVEVFTDKRVQSVTFATTMDELRQA